jgi:hypothetical protein
MMAAHTMYRTRATVFRVDIMHAPAQGLAPAATRAAVAAEVKRIDAGRRAAAEKNSRSGSRRAMTRGQR